MLQHLEPGRSTVRALNEEGRIERWFQRQLEVPYVQQHLSGHPPLRSLHRHRGFVPAGARIARNEDIHPEGLVSMWRNGGRGRAGSFLVREMGTGKAKGNEPVGIPSHAERSVRSA